MVYTYDDNFYRYVMAAEKPWTVPVPLFSPLNSDAVKEIMEDLLPGTTGRGIIRYDPEHANFMECDAARGSVAGNNWSFQSCAAWAQEGYAKAEKSARERVSATIELLTEEERLHLRNDIATWSAPIRCHNTKHHTDRSQCDHPPSYQQPLDFPEAVSGSRPWGVKWTPRYHRGGGQVAA